MLILYTTVSCSTAGEVISTALYCKHWSYSRASEASYQAGVHPYFCQAITKGRNFWIHCPHIHAQATCILLDLLSLEPVGLLFFCDEIPLRLEVKEHLCVTGSLAKISIYISTYKGIFMLGVPCSVSNCPVLMSFHQSEFDC